MADSEIAVAITFLAGRYHGEEWPPSGARLYQALVAGVMTGRYRDLMPEVEPALRWLEKQKAPRIFASRMRQSKPYRIAVPNNDLDQAGLEWSAGREAQASKYRTMKAIAPSVVDGDGPHVVYVWEADREHVERWAEPLRKAAHCLHTLGWGVDMAFADVVAPGTQMPVKQYVPTEHGHRWLKVPIDGTLDDLRATYKRFVARASGKGVDTYTRPSMIDMRRYGVRGEMRNPVVRFRLLDAECENNLSVPWSNGMKVAGWLRHAAGQVLRSANWAEERVQAYIEGHTAESEKGNRVSYVPLPSIAGSHGDGRIRRVMLVEPAASDGQAVKALQQFLAGYVLTNQKGEPAGCLLPSTEAWDATFARYVSGGDGWRTWRSVTPVVLHGFNVQRRGVIDLRKTEKLLLRAFEMAGFPPDAIEDFSFQAGPLWRGCGHASAMLVPEQFVKYPRVHVQLKFKEPVLGPVLAGIGRHYGIGVFAGVDL